ncbi:MAG: MBL fold metallo-hydrolase [Clostridia bacterium]|nr:MBL fold metallo-hydrolase [Clostridia bacterium]
MNRLLRSLLCAICLCALLAGIGATVSAEGTGVTLLAASVGKGDALLIKLDGWVGLIDTGKAVARGKVLSAMAALDVDALDAVFITHTDNDHTGGLEWLAHSDIPVDAFYASAMYTGVKPKKHPALQAAAVRGEEVTWLSRGDVLALGDTGAVLEVLAPATLFTDKDDNNSLVMMLSSPDGRILLTGDMELPEEAALLSMGDDLRCDVLKAPNHGDDDTLSGAFISAASPKLAVISTDSQDKPGTPDPGVLARLRSAGAQVCVTQDAGLGLRVTLSGGAVDVTALDIPEPVPDGVALASVTAGDDLVTIRNDGGTRDLTGWYLYSGRGNELYAFPDGYALEAGRAVTVGTRSSEAGSYDLLWDDKKVIHPSKRDELILFDPWGRQVDAMDNGR